MSFCLESLPTPILLDLIFKGADEDRDSFNAKLSDFRAQHPEVTQVEVPESIDCAEDPNHDACVTKPPEEDSDFPPPERSCPPGQGTNEQGECVRRIE